MTDYELGERHALLGQTREYPNNALYCSGFDRGAWLHLAAEYGALKHACTQALALLTDPEADDADADRVTRLLEVVLSPTSSAQV